jgi:hypothetical protein
MKLAGKCSTIWPFVDIELLGVKEVVMVAAFPKTRSSSAMIIENCVARVPDV